jgi:hypothetical protein
MSMMVYTGMPAMCIAIAAADWNRMSSHICDRFLDEGGHFFPSDLDKFTWVVRGWVGGRLKE